MQKALETAKKAAAVFLPAIVAIERRRDSEFPDRPDCYVVNEKSDSAIVVYLDEPETVVSTGNYAGRFVAE